MHPALPRVLVFAFTVAAFGAGPILGQGNIAQEAPAVIVGGVEFATILRGDVGSREESASGGVPVDEGADRYAVDRRNGVGVSLGRDRPGV